MSNPNEPVEDRFWRRVQKTDTCWLWLGARWGTGGYGVLRINRKGIPIHRVSWFIHKGEWPDPDLTLDHLCMNKLCVNPDHLEQVTRVENVRRASEALGIRQYATHCVNGHEFTPENTHIRSTGTRRCRACDREIQRRIYREKRASA
jgi:hypothetical protein